MGTLVSTGTFSIIDLNDGSSSYTATVYTQQFGTPDTPTGGSFDFSTKTLGLPSDPNSATNPSTGATIWSASIPTSSTTPTYASTFLFFVTPPATVATGGTWSTPVDFVVSGTNAISGQLSNDSVNIPANSLGVVANGTPYNGSGTEVRVYEGATLLNYNGTGTTNGTWTVSASGTGITASVTKTTLGTIPFQYVSYGNHSLITADVASITYTITGKSSTGVSFSFIKTQVLIKNKAGVDGGQIVVSATPPSNPTVGQQWWDTVSGTMFVWYTDTATIPKSSWISSSLGMAGPIGVNGASGDSVDIVFVRSATTPSTPTASIGVPYSDIQWYGTVAEANVINVTNPLWSSTGFKAASLGNYTWDAPTRIDGSAVAEVTAYKRSATPITVAPTAGTYTFGTTPVFVPPSAWSNFIPAGTDPLYTSRAVAYTSSSNTSAVTITGWTTPVLSMQNGAPGTPAQYVIVTGEQAFKYATGATTPISTSIALIAGLFGGLTAYQWEYYTGAGWSTLSAPFNTSTYSLAYNNAAFTGNSLRVRCVSGSTYFDEITIVKLYDGAVGTAAVSGYLTNETVTVPSAYDGSGASLTGTSGTFRVFNGITEVTSGATPPPTYSVSPTVTSGLTMSITTAGVYSLSGTWDTTTNSLTFTLSAVYSGIILTKVYTITKSKAGTPGASGTRGIFRTYAATGTLWTSGATYIAGQQIYYGLNWYTATAGTSGTVAPIHASGTVTATGGTATFAYATPPTWTANVDTVANTAITSMVGSGGVIIVGDEVTICSPNISAPTFVLTKYASAVGTPATTATWTARGQVIDGSLLVTGSVRASSLQAGINPLVSGTTMSGQGGIINSNGTFAIGNSSSNITYNGTSTYINGPVIASGSFSSGSFTSASITSGSISGTSLSVGTAALASGATTMTTGTQGLAVNSAGGFTVGNADTNITFNGTKLYLNGSIVNTENLVAKSVVENVSIAINSKTLLGTNTANGGTTTTLLAAIPIPSVSVETNRIVIVNLIFDHNDTTPGYITVNLAGQAAVADVPTRMVLSSNTSNHTFTFEVIIAANTTNIGELSISLLNGPTGFIWGLTSTMTVSGKVIVFTGKR